MLIQNHVQSGFNTPNFKPWIKAKIIKISDYIKTTSWKILSLKEDKKDVFQTQLDYPIGTDITYKKVWKETKTHKGKIFGYNWENVIIEIYPKNWWKLKFAINYKKIWDRVSKIEKEVEYKKVSFPQINQKKSKNNKIEINKETYLAISWKFPINILKDFSGWITELEKNYFSKHPEESQKGINELLVSIKKDTFLKFENILHKDLKPIFKNIQKIQIKTKKNKLNFFFRELYIEFLEKRLIMVKNILIKKEEDKKSIYKTKVKHKYKFTSIQLNYIKNRLYNKCKTWELNLKYIYELTLRPYLETKIVEIIQWKSNFNNLTTTDIWILAESMEQYNNSILEA